MHSRLLQAGFWLFGGAATVFALRSAGAVVVALLLAPGQLRLRVGEGRVVLSGIDPRAMTVSGLTIGVFPAISSLFGSWGAWVGVLVGLVFCGFGCRLRVHATPTRTTVVRTVWFVVPWRWRTYANPPSALVNGWG